MHMRKLLLIFYSRQSVFHNCLLKYIMRIAEKDEGREVFLLPCLIYDFLQYIDQILHVIQLYIA